MKTDKFKNHLVLTSQLIVLAADWLTRTERTQQLNMESLLSSSFVCVLVDSVCLIVLFKGILRCNIGKFWGESVHVEQLDLTC